MSRTPQDVTERELAVLQALWDGGVQTIRQLTDRLYPGGGTPQYATVQKLLDRLEGKGFVRRDRSPAAHTFAAAIARDELIGRRLQEVAEKLCGGSLTPLLMNLVRSQPLTPGELQELQDLVKELSRPARRKGEPRGKG